MKRLPKAITFWKVGGRWGCSQDATENLDKDRRRRPNASSGCLYKILTQHRQSDSNLTAGVKQATAKNEVDKETKILKVIGWERLHKKELKHRNNCVNQEGRTGCKPND